MVRTHNIDNYSVLIYEGMEAYNHRIRGIKLQYEANFIFVEKEGTYICMKRRYSHKSRGVKVSSDEILKKTLQYEYEAPILNKSW